MNTYIVRDALEEWRDNCVDQGMDPFKFTILYDPNMAKDLARHIVMRLRENEE